MIEFTIFEDCNLIRSFDERTNSAIMTHIVTRMVTPGIITREEFEEFVSAYTNYEEDDKIWVFNHPEFGEFSYDIDIFNMIDDDSEEDFDETVYYDEFLADIKDFFYEWGVEILEDLENSSFNDYSEDEDVIINNDAMKEIAERQDQNDYIDKNTTIGK